MYILVYIDIDMHKCVCVYSCTPLHQTDAFTLIVIQKLQII